MWNMLHSPICFFGHFCMNWNRLLANPGKGRRTSATHETCTKFALMVHFPRTFFGILQQLKSCSEASLQEILWAWISKEKKNTTACSGTCPVGGRMYTPCFLIYVNKGCSREAKIFRLLNLPKKFTPLPVISIRVWLILSIFSAVATRMRILLIKHLWNLHYPTLRSIHMPLPPPPSLSTWEIRKTSKFHIKKELCSTPALIDITYKQTWKTKRLPSDFSIQMIQ